MVMMTLMMKITLMIGMMTLMVVDNESDDDDYNNDSGDIDVNDY
jgi:hypothetical protein